MGNIKPAVLKHQQAELMLWQGSNPHFMKWCFIAGGKISGWAEFAAKEDVLFDVSYWCYKVPGKFYFAAMDVLIKEGENNEPQ